jgi:hypothetical protein
MKIKIIHLLAAQMHGLLVTIRNTVYNIVTSWLT